MEELGEMKPSSCVSAEVEVVDLPSVLCLLLRPSRLLPYKIHSIRSSVVKAAVYHNFEWVKILLANIFFFICLKNKSMLQDQDTFLFHVFVPFNSLRIRGRSLSTYTVRGGGV